VTLLAASVVAAPIPEAGTSTDGSAADQKVEV
jgi:hypothetical protein